MIFASELGSSLLENALNATLNGIIVVESVYDAGQVVIDFRCLFVNQTAREQALLLKNAQVGMLLSELLTPADFLPLQTIGKAVLASGEPYRGEHYGEQTNEWFNTHIARLTDSRLIITFANVTALKQAIFDHQQQASLFQNVLASTTNPVVICKPIHGPSGLLTDLQLVLFNPAAQDAWLFGTELREGALATQLLPPKEAVKLLEYCQQACQTGQTQRFQYRYPDSDRWLSLAVKKFDQGLILNAADVTEERHQQAVLMNMNRALQQSNENLQQFAYIASHDLQEPLRKIHSFGNLLSVQFADQLGENGMDLIRRMQAASGRMTTLIRDLLAYSRLTTHREPSQPVSLGRLIDEIIDDLSPLLQEGQATTDCEELPTVPGDVSQLRQLFQNLLINAVTYRHPDRLPIIRVSCRTLSGADVPEGLPPQKNYAEISVADNGIGFEERYAERIFQMFQRLHGRNQYTGTGVGLAICKRVVENHQGLIMAHSVPGQGSTFRIVLPL